MENQFSSAEIENGEQITNRGNQKKKAVIALIAMFLISIGGIFGYFVANLSKDNSQNTPIPSGNLNLNPKFPLASSAVQFAPTSQSPTPIKTPDITENWKIYTNNKYGFQIKYPPQWYSCNINNEDKMFILSPHSRVCQEDTSELPPGDVAFPIHIYVKTDIKSKAEFVAPLQEDYKVTVQENLDLPFDSTSYSVEQLHPAPGPEKRIMIITPLHNNFLIFEVNELAQTQYAFQILSTLKFLPLASSRPTDETANWKVYNDWEFQLKYPPAWIAESLAIDSPIAHGVVSLKPSSWQNDPRAGQVTVSYWDNPDNLSLQSYEQKYPYSRVYDAGAKQVRVDTKTGYLSSKADCEPFYCDKLIVPITGKILELDNFFTAEQTIPEERKIFDQILSTLKLHN